MNILELRAKACGAGSCWGFLLVGRKCVSVSRMAAALRLSGMLSRVFGFPTVPRPSRGLGGAEIPSRDIDSGIVGCIVMGGHDISIIYDQRS